MPIAIGVPPAHQSRRMALRYCCIGNIFCVVIKPATLKTQIFSSAFGARDTLNLRNMPNGTNDLGQMRTAMDLKG